MMTLFITRTEHRDTQAIHAKIDELWRAHGEARTELAHLDEKDVEEIEAHRSETRQAARDSSEGNIHRWRARPRHKATLLGDLHRATPWLWLNL
jgi:low affinity Fe/Cu permease